MPSRSSANLLDLAAADSNFPSPPRHPARLPRVMADPGILSLTDAATDDSPPVLMCSMLAPSMASPTASTPLTMTPSLPMSASSSTASLSSSPRTSTPTSTMASASITFGPSSTTSSPSSLGSLRFDLSLWRSYLSANKFFTDRLTEVLNPDDDFIWIQDYHLLVLPSFLRKCFHRVKLRIFLHSPFPSSEIFHTIIIIAGSFLHPSLSLLSASGTVLLTASLPQFTSSSHMIYNDRFIPGLFSRPAPLAVAICPDTAPRRRFPSPLPLSSCETKEGKPPWVNAGKKKRKKK